MKQSPFMLAVLLIGSGLCLAGCSPVAPWERGNLAKPHMALDPTPLQSALLAHSYGAREAASGGATAGGGGCGCY